MSTPKEVLSLLAAADAKNGFPMGTMASVMKQEVGGNPSKYLEDPSAYHYGLGSDGRRVAPHTGKVSTAFGPFGILESTAADPGYGVQPLKDKSLAEQIRFSSDYLAARSKGAGSLVGGLAGYGEGTKYAQQVAGRTAGASPVVPIAAPAPVAVTAPVPEPVVMASAPEAPQVAAAPVAEVPAPVQLAAAAASPTPDAWQTFLKSMPQSREPVQVADINGYGQQPMQQVVVPQFQAGVPQQLRPNFASFGTWGNRSRMA